MQYLVSVAVLVALLAIRLISGVATRWKRQEIIRRFGCRPIVKFPSTEPFGRDYDRVVKKSFQDGRVNHTAMELYEKCGSSTYQVHALNDRAINTLEPANHQTMVTKTDDWKKDVRRGAYPLFGVNILDQDGAAWKRSRDLINPLFRRAEVQDIEYFREFVDRFFERIPRDGSTIDMQPLLRKLFLDSSTEFIFGESIDSLRDQTDTTENFIATFNRAVAGAGNRIRPTGLKLIFNNMIGGVWDQKWLADCKAVHDYVDRCIARYRRQAPKDPVHKHTKRRYVLIEGMSKAILDPVDLRFQLLGIFLQARETSAMAFTNVLFMLARNPEVWAELHAQASSLGDDEIGFEQLNRLSFFRFTVLEAIRLHCPITRVRRVAARDTVLPLGGGPGGSSPAFVPKGTTMWGDRFPKTRDPKIWGDDVEAFRPSRFEGKGNLGWEFQPFSGGPRVCPANQQVITQCMYLLFRLTRQFASIQNRDPCLEYVEGVMMCFESRNGCKIALHPARV